MGGCGGAGGEAGMLLKPPWWRWRGAGENKSHPRGVLEALFGERIILWVRKAAPLASSGTLILEGQGERGCRESPLAGEGGREASQPATVSTTLSPQGTATARTHHSLWGRPRHWGAKWHPWPPLA